MKKNKLVPRSPRTITILGKINEDNVGEFCRQMALFEAESDEPVVVEICSSGGDVDAGLALYNRLRLSPLIVITVALGRAWSMALDILQAGKVRCIAPDASILIHNPTEEVEGKFQARDFKNMFERTDDVERRSHRFYARHSGQSVSVIRKWAAQNSEFVAEDAVRHGFADLVLRHGKGGVLPQVMKWLKRNRPRKR